MLNSLKGCICFNLMINSIMSLTLRKSEISKKEETIESRVKQPRKRKISRMNQSQKEVTEKRNMVKQSTGKASTEQKQNNQQMKCPQSTKQHIMSNIQLNQILPDSQRSLIERSEALSQHVSHQRQQQKQLQRKQKQLQEEYKQSQYEQNQLQREQSQLQSEYRQSEDEDNQDDFPTQKSQIIMNDIGKSVNYIQNMFLYGSQEERVEKFQDIYHNLVHIQPRGIYQEFQVTKKTTNQKFKAFIMIGFQTFQNQIDSLRDKQDLIEAYCDLYQREKTHLKNFLVLTKNNSRHLLKLIDYELIPPIIDLSNNNQFTTGSLSIVFENVQYSLEQYLKGKRSVITQNDKKKIVYQLLTCLMDVHEAQMSIKDLSLRSFAVDRFQNIKLSSLQIEEFNCRSLSKNLISFHQHSQTYLYLTPEELGCHIDSGSQQNMRNSYFHSGFSVISDFDKIESSQQKQDLWKLGVIITKILTGKFPFDSPDRQEQKVNILKVLQRKESSQKSTVSSDIFEGLCQNSKRIVFSLLQIQASERKSCKQLLEQDYFKNNLDDSY